MRVVVSVFTPGDASILEEVSHDADKVKTLEELKAIVRPILDQHALRLVSFSVPTG